MEGSHSLFGLIWQIASATGWSIHQIVWEIPYPVILLMIADAPRWISSEELKKQKSGMPIGIKGTSALELFQTMLKTKG